MQALREGPSPSSPRTINYSLERKDILSVKMTLVLTLDSLINVLKAGKQEVPEALLKFGGTVKKKQHDAYGAFFKANDDGKTATKITFDD